MSNVIQAFKLQFYALYKFFIVDFLVAIIGVVLIKFLGNTVENYTFVLTFELAFSIFLGIYNAYVCGDTYYSLKHDRHNFLTSSLLVMLINALIITLIYLLVPLFLSSSIKLLSVIIYFLVMCFAFLLGSVYALFIAKIKLINVICVTVLLVGLLLFGSFVLKFGNFLTDYLVNGEKNKLLVIIIALVLSIGLGILSSIKYLKLKK